MASYSDAGAAGATGAAGPTGAAEGFGAEVAGLSVHVGRGALEACKSGFRFGILKTSHPLYLLEISSSSQPSSMMGFNPSHPRLSTRFTFRCIVRRRLVMLSTTASGRLDIKMLIACSSETKSRIFIRLKEEWNSQK